MRICIYLSLACAFLSLSANSAANAKDFPISSIPQHPRLQDFESFSLECQNKATGTIDREDVDVENGTVTVSIPGMEPKVHDIIGFNWNLNTFKDRFDTPKARLFFTSIRWGNANERNVGLIFDLTRWYSRHREDGQLWWCANY